MLAVAQTLPFCCHGLYGRRSLLPSWVGRNLWWRSPNGAAARQGCGLWLRGANLKTCDLYPTLLLHAISMGDGWQAYFGVQSFQTHPYSWHSVIFMNSIWSSVNRCLGKLCEDVTKLRLIRQNRWMAFWYLLISITFATRKSANIYHISKTLCESAISVTFFNFNHQGPQDAARPGGPWSKSWHRSPRRANICGPRASCARRSRGFCVPQKWDGLGLRNDWNILK